jgi:hypothetical protein
MPPSTIMFLRHAEKPGEAGPPLGVDRHGQNDPHSLSVQGWTRAGALAALFDSVPSKRRPGLARPTRVIATEPTHDYKSKRERDTATPTAHRIHVTIESDFTHKDVAAAAKSILASDGDALVVWHHGSMPELLSHFPIRNSSDVPAQWPEDRFDLIWTLTRGTSDDYTVATVNQDLLADDLT